MVTVCFMQPYSMIHFERSTGMVYHKILNAGCNLVLVSGLGKHILKYSKTRTIREE